MTFSLRTLLLIVLLGAIYALALTHTTTLWAAAMAYLTIAILVAATLAVWLGRVNGTFWIPFCLVGWLHLILAFTPSNINRLNALSPGAQVSYYLFNEELPDQVFSDGSFSYASLRTVEGFSRPYLDFMNTVQSLITLVLAGIAGIAGSFLLRPRSNKSSSSGTPVPDEQ